MTDLRISPDLALPLEAVTETFAIIAKRRVGKSNAAVVMAEQMYDAGIPWVAIDPKGDWWGVRSSGDGKGEGLAVPVFGGLHADVPLEPSAGAYMADLIADRRLTCVLDISQFSKAEEIRFLQPLAERLLKVNSEPLHLFFEECDDYIPQEKAGDELHVVRAFSRLVRHGGFKGIGSTLITQRAALVSKNVLAQTETLIVFRTTHPPDQKQVADWIKGHEASAAVLPTLSSLPVGQAWVLSPGFLGTVEQVTFNRRRTFDSGATPKVGQKRTDPTRLADVDLAVIKEAMAETIERAKADDPKELRKRIAELERQLRDQPIPEPERIEVPVLTDTDRAVVDTLRATVEAAAEQWTEVTRSVTQLADRIGAQGGRTDVPRTRPAGDAARPVGAGRRATQRPDPPVRREPSRPTIQGSAAAADVGADVQLGKGERVILTAVAQYPDGVTREQLTVLTGYKRSSRDTYLQRLRNSHLINVDDGRIFPTLEGVDALGDDYQPLPTGAALRDHWLRTLTGGEQAILGALIDAYPAGVSKDVLSERTGYKRSSRDTYLQRLRSRQLVTTDGEPRVADVLFESA